MAIFATVLALTISGGIFLGGKKNSAPTPPREVAREQEKLTPSVPEIADPRSSLIPGLPSSPETQAPPSNIIPGLSEAPGLPAPTTGNAGTEITFPIPESTDAASQAKLNKIIFPRIDFRDATLIECVDFLNFKSKELDPQKVGVSVVIAPSIPSSTTGLRLTLQLNNVPQMEVLNYVAHLCGLEFRIDSSGVTLLPKDDTKSVERIQNAAAQGNSMAQFDLGVAYANGRGVRKDEAKAFEWFRKAGAQGHAVAQFNIGFMYANGQGVPTDVAKSIEWYQKAAAQGNSEAKNELGLFYLGGKGIPEDDAKAFACFQNAAGQGNPVAQYNLAFMYASGKGVPKDDIQSFEWCQKSAAQGNAPAQFNLGVAYANGQGVRKDESKAFVWFQKAAAQGNSEAKEWIRNYQAASQARPPSK